MNDTNNEGKELGSTSATTEAKAPFLPGVYQMKCTDAELGFTSGSEGSEAKPQVALMLVFCDGPNEAQGLTWYGFFTEKTKAGTIRALRTLGWVGDDLGDLSTCRGEAPCTVVTEVDLNGNPRSKIRWIGGGALANKNPMNEDQKKAFAMSMRDFAKSIAGDISKAKAENGTKVDEKKFF